MAGRLFRKTRLLTRPTLARRDAPFPKQGRNERRGDAYSAPYVEPLSDARTPLAGFINSLPEGFYAIMAISAKASESRPRLQDSSGFMRIERFLAQRRWRCYADS